MLALALVGWALHRLVEPLGLGWVVFALGGLVAFGFVAELVVRARRREREREGWKRARAAVLDAELRGPAIRALRSELARARRLGARTAVRQARLAIALAELQLADGSDRAATDTLSRVPIDALEDRQATAVRLARAQAYLHRGDHRGAGAPSA